MISLFSIIALGFFLGMRHATDPDHVNLNDSGEIDPFAARAPSAAPAA